MDNFMQNFEYFKQYYFSDDFVMKVVIPGLMFILILMILKMILNWIFRINSRIREMKNINSNLEQINENMKKLIEENDNLNRKVMSIQSRIEKLSTKPDEKKDVQEENIENRGE